MKCLVFLSSALVSVAKHTLKLHNELDAGRKTLRRERGEERHKQLFTSLFFQKNRKKNIKETLLSEIIVVFCPWKVSKARFSHHTQIQENALLSFFLSPPSQ